MDLSFEIKDNLSPDFCKKIIERFENDDRKVPGQTGLGLVPQIKNSSDLMISRFLDWENVVKVLDEKLKENLLVYQEFLDEKLPLKYDILGLNMTHSGYQIQKSGFYRWHQDSSVEYGRDRFLTFIWYLNTIEEGGQTGLVFKNIKPETGKFLFFPATWDYIHCGFDANNKYIITGWLWKSLPQESHS